MCFSGLKIPRDNGAEIARVAAITLPSATGGAL
jgi:hypothetical protein